MSQVFYSTMNIQFHLRSYLVPCNYHLPYSKRNLETNITPAFPLLYLKNHNSSQVPTRIPPHKNLFHPELEKHLDNTDEHVSLQ